MKLDLLRPPTGNDAGQVDAWFTPGRFAVLLGLLIFAMFPDVILAQRTFFFRDFQIFAYPWAHYHRESVWRGEIPLWNPLSNCGLPFLAQWNTMTLYPLSLVYLLLPLSWSLGMFCLLHLFLGGLGMYRLAYRWTNHGWAAALAGTAFAFNGLTLNSLMWTNNIAALGWMPWVVFLAERSWREGRIRVIQAAFIGALQMLTGAPEIIFLTWVLVSALWLGECVQRATPLTQMLSRFLAVVALVAGLCAIQLLPFWDLLVHSQRDRNFGAAMWPMPMWGLGNFFVPLFFSFPWAQNVFFQYDQYWTASYYVGVGTVTLAILALAKLRSARTWWLGLMLVVSLVLAMGDNGLLYAWLKKLVPALGFMRYPIKFVVLAVLILPVLAAFGAGRILATQRETRDTERRKLAIITLIVLAVISFILWYAFSHPRYRNPVYNKWPETLASGLTRSVFLLAFSSGLFVLPRMARIRSQWLIRLGLLLLVWLDVLTHAPRQNPTVERWVYDPVAELRHWSPAPRHGESRAMPSLAAELEMHNSALPNAAEDYMRKRMGLYCNCNLLENIPKVNGVFSLHLREAEQVNTLMYGSTDRHFPRLADFLNVSQITTPGKTIDWVARTNYLPLISSGQQPVFVTDDECLRGLESSEFNSRETVFLPIEMRNAMTVTTPSELRIVSHQISSQRMLMQVEGREPGLLVISQTFYHPWKAYVDGAPVRLWRANHAFQAIEVPAGQHQVTLAYEDRQFRRGAFISGITLLVCVVTWFRQRKQLTDPSSAAH
jgi:hypothetical protein